MTYKQTISYLYDHLPMFSRIGAAAYKKDLYNTIALSERLHHPERKFRSIHVAGTNGKGSTSHMLAAILQKSGYKTGLYTSPHIKDFKERILINGIPVSEQFVTEFVERTKTMSDEIQPSFFELTVMMAFEYFASQEVDIAVIETGLGGLLDSTNIITPVLSVITNIGYDHQNLLGNTLEEIAFQKAGIIKKGVPVVVGETLPETKEVFAKKAKEEGTPIIFAEEKYIAEFTDAEGELLFCNIRNTETDITEKLRLGLSGLYQVKNACTVLAAIDTLRSTGFNITEKALHEGVEFVRDITHIKGRWEILQSKPAVIADVAHNKDGIRNIIAQLENTYPAEKMHFVLGFVHDKDVDEVLRIFPANASYYFTNAHIPRALPVAELKEKAFAAGISGEGFDNVNAAFAAAKSNALEDEVIMICGSFFIIGELNIL
jgi:dihydrofolate synthase/folylpolyglutamate synthase